MIRELKDTIFHDFIDTVVAQTDLTSSEAQAYTLTKCQVDQKTLSAELQRATTSISEAQSKIENSTVDISPYFYELDDSDIVVPLHTEHSYALPDYDKKLHHKRPLVEILPKNNRAALQSVDILTFCNCSDVIDINGGLSKGSAQHLAIQEVGQLYKSFQEPFSEQETLDEVSVQVIEGIWTSYINPQTNESAGSYLRGIVPEETTLTEYGNLQNQLKEGYLTHMMEKTAEPFTIGPSVDNGEMVSIPTYDDIHYTDIDWLFLVGSIGTGKTTTKNILLRQLTDHKPDATIIEFDPVESSIIPLENCEGIQRTASGVSLSDAFDKLLTILDEVEKSNDEIYLVFDQAYYIFQKQTEILNTINAKLESGTVQSAIFCTQNMEDFSSISAVDTDNMYWIFSNLSQTLNSLGSTHIQQFGFDIEYDLNSLEMPGKNSYPEVVLKTAGKPIEVCSVNPTELE